MNLVEKKKGEILLTRIHGLMDTLLTRIDRNVKELLYISVVNL